MNIESQSGKILKKVKMLAEDKRIKKDDELRKKLQDETLSKLGEEDLKKLILNVYM